MNSEAKKYLTVAISAVACVALIGSFWPAMWEPPATEEIDVEEDDAVIRLSPSQITATRLNVMPARTKQLKIVHTFPARIVLNGNRYAHVTTEATGVAREVRKDLGDIVRAGEVLAVLESRDIAEAKANYLAALRREALMKGSLAREHHLHQRQVSAEIDFLKADSEAAQATIERELAEQKLLAIGFTEEQLAKLPETPSSQLRLYELLAPFAGTVVERDISPGELIPAGKEPFAVADLSTVWVDIGVHPQDIDKIHKGQQVTIRNPNSEMSGSAIVVYQSPIVDSETRAARVIAEIDNQDGQWRPGTYVQASVQTESKKAAVTVPKGSIQRIDGEDVVFIQHGDGVQARVVETGLSDDEDVEILQGLTLDDCCATQNTFVLKSELLKSDEEE